MTSWALPTNSGNKTAAAAPIITGANGSPGHRAAAALHTQRQGISAGFPISSLRFSAEWEISAGHPGHGGHTRVPALVSGPLNTIILFHSRKHRKRLHVTGRWWWVSFSVTSDSCYPMDCSRPGSSVHGILWARILERAAIPFSRGLS